MIFLLCNVRYRTSDDYGLFPTKHAHHSSVFPTHSGIDRNVQHPSKRLLLLGWERWVVQGRSYSGAGCLTILSRVDNAATALEV
jgi:hypothetical protein